MIVISSAIKKNNPELIASKAKKLPIFKRGEMLANIVALKKILLLQAHMEKLQLLHWLQIF
jgi:UDP-N-acetylmuramate--alanine ligase